MLRPMDRLRWSSWSSILTLALLIPSVANAQIGGGTSRMGKSAFNDGRSPLADRVRDASFIFEGEVLSVEWRNADVFREGQVAAPHTFVTFRIDGIFKGKAPLDALGQPKTELTLRFLGGPDGTGRTLTTSHLTYFDIGQRTILMVKRNGSYACPLVTGQGRRLRLVNEEVYWEDGSEILIRQNQRLTQGKRHDLEEVLTIRIGNETYQIQRSSLENEDGNQEGDPKGQRLSPEDLRIVLHNIVQSVHTQEELDALPPVEDTDITDRLVFFDPRAVAPPQGDQ